MGIEKVCITNFRAIKKLEFDLSKGDINCLLGKNGVGKTTIDKAILYFYEVANKQYSTKDIIDKKNPYIQKSTIEITYSFSCLNENREHNIHVDNDLSEFEKYIHEEKLIVKMTQYKDGQIEWYPINNRNKVRKILKIFPVYLVNTREVTSEDWLALWDVVSDIAVTGIKEDDTTVKQTLSNNFEAIYGKKYSKAVELIDKVLVDEKISVNERDYKKRFKNALMSNVGGDIFMLEDNDFDFYSSGINSLKFQSLFIKLISELSKIAWKEVLIILDEPEISLHLQYVEELSEVIGNACKNVKFVLATHSTRLVSCLLKESDINKKVIFNQVYSKNGYTGIQRINDIVSEKEKYLVRDNEAESYFSNMIMFVEGQTEIQLFKNRQIVNLFPVLKKLTIYNTESNDSATKIILPKTNTPAIPYVVLIDMDKILDYSDSNNTFFIKKGNTAVNPLGDKERERREVLYYYSMQKKITFERRKQIKKMLSKKMEVGPKNYYNQDHNYDKLITLVKKYCRFYKTIVVSTTIEGSIICKESYDKFQNWLVEYWGNTKYNQYLQDISSMDEVEKLNITRCIFHGKTDYLKSIDKEKQNKYIPKLVADIIEKYTSGKKTDGWTFLFFEWYFKKYMIGNEDDNRIMFSQDFPEIFDVIHYVEYMIE